MDSEWRALCGRWEKSGYEALSEDERTWLNVRSLIDAVENGGLISYFYNSGADTLLDCRLALGRLGAQTVLRHVDRVARLFGSEVPLTVESRNVVIESWPDDGTHDSLLEEVDEVLMPLVHELDEELEVFLVRAGLIERP